MCESQWDLQSLKWGLAETESCLYNHVHMCRCLCHRHSWGLAHCKCMLHMPNAVLKIVESKLASILCTDSCPDRTSSWRPNSSLTHFPEGYLTPTSSHRTLQGMLRCEEGLNARSWPSREKQSLKITAASSSAPPAVWAAPLQHASVCCPGSPAPNAFEDQQLQQGHGGAACSMLHVQQS